MSPPWRSGEASADLRRQKRRRQKYRSWDVDDVREMEHDRRYQAWKERQARDSAQGEGDRDADGAGSQQVRVRQVSP